MVQFGLSHSHPSVANLDMFYRYNVGPTCTSSLERSLAYISCATDHVARFPRTSPSVFAYCKRSKTGGVHVRRRPGTRLRRIIILFLLTDQTLQPPVCRRA